MEIMNIETPKNNEVMTFDFEANKVCGEKISKDDATAICGALFNITNKASVVTGFYLLALKEKADLQELGYKDIYDLGKSLLGLSRGVVSERIQVANRFRSSDKDVFALDDKWKDYKYTALLNMRKMTDEEISAANITSQTLALEIKDIADNKPENKKPENKKPEDKKPEDKKPETNDSSDSEQETNDSSDSETEIDFANIVELKASEIPQSLRVALDKYMRAHNIDSHAILQINMDK